MAVRPPYFLSIYDDQGQLITYCNGYGTYGCGTNGTTKSVTVSVPNNGTRTFTAYVSQDFPAGSIPVNDVRAVSNTASVHNTGWTGTALVGVSRTEVDVHDEIGRAHV